MVEAFTGTTVEAYYISALKDVVLRLRSMPSREVREADPQSLVDSLAHQYLLDRIEEGPERPPEAVEDTDVVRVFLMPRAYTARTMRLRGSGWVGQHSYREHTMFDESTQAVQLRVPTEQIGHALGILRQRLKFLTTDVDQFTPNFMESVWGVVKQQQQALAAEYGRTRSALDAAGVTIVRRPNAMDPVNVQIRKDVQVLRAPQLPAVKPADPQLNPNSLNQILALIDQAGHNFEAAPTVFGSLREEDLRTIILGYLNAVFAWPAASGESFSVSGKTDILLNAPGGAVLVGECHWWDGEAAYIAKLEQLFGYIAFRHTAALMITFSKRESLTAVVDTATAATRTHSSLRGTVGEPGATRRVSTHEHPRDPEKTIDVYHFLFDLHHPGGTVRRSGTRRRR